jgi:hypothetical protein
VLAAGKDQFRSRQFPAISDGKRVKTCRNSFLAENQKSYYALYLQGYLAP